MVNCQRGKGPKCSVTDNTSNYGLESQKKSTYCMSWY